MTIHQYIHPHACIHYPTNTRLVQCTKVKVIYSISIIMSKTHMIIPVDVGKAFDSIHCFKTKAFNKPGKEGNFLNMMQGTCATHKLTLCLLLRARTR